MTFLLEARAALRPWLRRPWVALAAIGSIALGLAAAISVFAISDAVLWRPLPLPEADRLVWITSADRGLADGTSPGVFSTWATQATSLTAVGALRPAQAILRDIAPGERSGGVYASAGVFVALGVTPVVGRSISAEDDRPGAPAVMMLSHRLWQTSFGGNTSVIGRAVHLDGRPRVVIGVMPASLDGFPFAFDWWAPLALTAGQAANVGPRYLDVLGRLGAADPSIVEQELTTLSASAHARGDTGLPLAIRVEPLQRHVTGDARPVLLPLLGAVLTVVLLAAVNAANLLLAHGFGRRAELALRASLGASRSRVTRQLLLEAMWLTTAAGALSLVLSLWIIDALKVLLPLEPAALAGARLDPRVGLFAVALVAAVTALCGLLPAVRNSRLALREGLAGRSGGSGHDRLRRAFVVVQVALALTVGTAAALMVRSTLGLGAVQRGYDERVVSAALQFPRSDYPDATRLKAAVSRVVLAAASVPGAEAAAAATRLPLSGGAPGSDVALTSERFTPAVDRQVRVRFVTPGYFATVGTPLRDGRDVAATDVASGTLVVVVNETLARRLQGRGSVVGHAVKFAVPDFNVRGPDTPWQVVGVVADTRDSGPRAAVQPEVYLAMAQGPGEVFEWIGRQVLVAVRPQQTPGFDVRRLRSAIAEVEPALALFDVLTLEQRLRLHLSPERVMAAVLLPLAAAAMGLSALGIFALLTQFVVSRRRELAIRIALGATPGRMVNALISEGLTLMAVGVILGLAGAFMAGRSLGALMFGVAPLDAVNLASMVALTLTTTLLAVWLPARRAARVDPAAVLRAE